MLAAANSIFGRWDEDKGDENIDFMPTILSRFDMIFIVRDEHSESRDTVCFGINSFLSSRSVSYFIHFEVLRTKSDERHSK